MAKDKSGKGGKGKSPAPVRKRKLPNWPLLGLSVAGMALSGYLSVTGWTSAGAAFCIDGSGCDIVQSSQWGTLLGAPVAFWGFLNYLGLGWIAFRVRSGEWHWKLSFVLSLIGVAVSVNLTVISVTVLDATCAYCLTSLGLITAILALTIYQYPGPMVGFAWSGWLFQTGLVAAAVVMGMHAYHSGALGVGGAEDPYLKSLAVHLSQSDVKFYGAYW